MIPQDRQQAVENALRTALGTSAIDSVKPLTRGLSSDLVYRIEIHGHAYVLRLVTHLERKDPARVFAIMSAAAEAGLAPRVWHASAEDGIALTDFVHPQPFPQERRRTELPRLLRRLHDLPSFPKGFNFGTVHRGFIWRFKTAGLLPDWEIAGAFAEYKRICSVYPRAGADMVSCHMDLKPENIVFDGARAWLVDWEAAHVNDRYYDLAIVANFVGNSEQLLSEYFGVEPNPYQLARFRLMQQILHLFYAAVFLLIGSKGSLVDDRSDLPSFEEFHRRIWAGEINLADDAHKVTYGLIHWKRLIEGFARPDFEAALAEVGAANASDFQRLLPDESA